MLRRKNQTISLELVISQAKHNHSTKILLLCVIIIFFIIGLFVLVGRNPRKEMEYWWVAIIVYACLLSFIILSIIEILRQSSSFIIRKLDARLATERTNPELLKTIYNFSNKANITAPSLYITKKKCITSLSVGWSSSKSIIILSSWVIDALEKEELGSIIAHELSHICHRDYPLRIILFFSAGLFFSFFYGVAQVCICNSVKLLRDIRDSSQWYRIFSDRGFIYLPSLFIVVPISIVFAWCIGIPLRRIIIEQEYRADLGSVEITGKPSVLALAIAKLALACQVPIDDSSDFFMLFDMVKPSCRNEAQQKHLEFFQGSVMGRVVKRATRLDSMV